MWLYMQGYSSHDFAHLPCHLLSTRGPPPPQIGSWCLRCTLAGGAGRGGRMAGTLATLAMFSDKNLSPDAERVRTALSVARGEAPSRDIVHEITRHILIER